MKNLLLAVCALLAASVAFAADVTGTWKAEMTTPDGQKRESSFVLKQDGAALTGKVVSPRGETDIKDGKVDGDNVSFTVIRNVNGNEMKSEYTGAVEGKTMKLKVKMGDRGPIDMTATKSES